MSTTRRRLVLFVAAAAAALAFAASRADAQTFTTVGMPDTQNYSEFFPGIFHDQTQWIADHIGSLNIRFVAQSGDLVNHGGSVAEWAVADSATSTLDLAGIPYGVPAGNHDVTPAFIPLPSPGDTATLAAVLPPEPAFAGISLWFQAFALDAAAPQGVAMSNGLQATLCPPGT